MTILSVKTKKNPPKEELHAWEPTNEPWQRIHIDFTGPLKGCWYLMIVDAYTKWVEVFPQIRQIGV